jgi:hypothetical protein
MKEKNNHKLLNIVQIQAFSMPLMSFRRKTPSLMKKIILEKNKQNMKNLQLS